MLKNLCVVSPSTQFRISDAVSYSEEQVAVELVSVDASTGRAFGGKHFPTSGYTRGKKMKMEKKPTLVSRTIIKKKIGIGHQLSGIDVVESKASTDNIDQAAVW